jgi:hypothetical protein
MDLDVILFPNESLNNKLTYTAEFFPLTLSAKQSKGFVPDPSTASRSG